MASITSSSSLLANFAKNCHFRWHRMTLLKLSLKAEVWIRALTIDIKPFNAPDIFLESFLSNAPRFNLSMCGWYLAHFSHLHECTNHIYGKWLTTVLTSKILQLGNEKMCRIFLMGAFHLKLSFLCRHEEYSTANVVHVDICIDWEDLGRRRLVQW